MDELRDLMRSESGIYRAYEDVGKGRSRAQGWSKRDLDGPKDEPTAKAIMIV
jgi:hypothetical protein